MLSRNGYSLVEMLVVVGIIGILAAVGVASYNQMNMESQVETEAKRIVSQLRSWQKDADSGIGSLPCNDVDTYGGIKVYIEQTPSADRLRAVSLCGTTETPLKTVELSYPAMAVDNKTFTFLPLAQGVDINDYVNLTMNSITYRITITTAGGISVSKP